VWKSERERFREEREVGNLKRGGRSVWLQYGGGGLAGTIQRREEKGKEKKKKRIRK